MTTCNSSRIAVAAICGSVLLSTGCEPTADSNPSGAAGSTFTGGAPAAGAGGNAVASPGGGGTVAGPGAGGKVGGNAGVSTGTGGVVIGAGGALGGGGVVTGGGGQQSAGGTSGGGAPTGGSSGMAAGGGGVATGGAGGGNPGTKPPCITKQSQIVIIGDSYVTGFAGTPALLPALQALEPSAAMWRNYAIAGMSMAQGGIPLGAPVGVAFVPDQFTEAIGIDKDIKLIIMDGGGNDALLPPGGSPAADCKNQAMAGTMPACQALVATTLMAARTLTLKMADAGVKDMIYFFYPHLPGTGVLSGTNPNAIDDYAYPLVQKECDGASMTTGGKISCHFIDTRPAFGSDYAANIAGDGVHPTDAGQKILAKLIIDKMKADCLGQASGCCAP